MNFLTTLFFLSQWFTPIHPTEDNPFPLCDGVEVIEWTPSPTTLQIESAQQVCWTSIQLFPQWIAPLKKIHPTVIKYRISFIPSGDKAGELNDLTGRFIDRASLGKVWGWTQYKRKIAYVTSDGPTAQSLAHELYHVQSHQYGIWKLYYPQDEEDEAEAFSGDVMLWF